MRSAFLLIGLIFSELASAGNWELKTTTDAMTDQVSSEAYLVSQEGDKFTVLKRSDGTVWGYLGLSGLNQFSINETLMIRVDKQMPREFSEKLDKISKNLGVVTKTWEWNPSLIAFQVWHGKVEEGCGMVRYLFDGKQMIIRYHPNQSTKRDIIFPLTGNQKALSEALGFDVAACPQEKVVE